MSGENERAVAAPSEEETRRRIAESTAIDENSRTAAQSVVDAAAKANKEKTPESVSEFDKTVDDLLETFRPKGKDFKNEGEALAEEIYLLLMALLGPLQLVVADRDITRKLQGKFDDLKAKIKGEEALVSVAESPTLATTAAAQVEADIPVNEDPSVTATTTVADTSAATTDNSELSDEDLVDEFGDDIDSTPAMLGEEDVTQANHTSSASPPLEDPVHAAIASPPPSVIPMMQEARSEADAEPVVNTSSGNLKSLLKKLEDDSNKAAWGVRDVKPTKTGVRLELEGGGKMYAKENKEGGLTYSFKKGMKDKERQNAVEKACQMSVDLAGHGATIMISPKLPEAQRKEIYDAIQKAMEKPENKGKGLKVEGYTPSETEILSTTPSARTTRPS